MHPPQILISEVGPRDGLQSVAAIMSTAHKCAWIDGLHRAGLREIEVASFVSAKRLPQMADAPEVVRHARGLAGLTVVALVPNLQGAQAALAAGAHKLTIPVSASQAHSLANVGKTREQMVQEVARICSLARAVAPQVRVEVGISTAFGCTLSGAVPEGDVLALATALVAAGAHEVGLSDTTGMANPAQVRRLFGQLRAAIGTASGAAHMHNTRGLGLANCLAALDAGVTTLDSSQGGLGGCPYAPGASGNVVTEDLVFMLQAMGLRTGVDADALLAARALLQAGLPHEPLYGMTPQVGWPTGAGAHTGHTPRPSAAPAPMPAAPILEAQAPTSAPTSVPPPPAKAALPYAGLRVVELSHMVMGPTCGLVLADLGAEVIKVEPIGQGKQGDGTRHLLGSGAGFFALFNRNKKSLALDLQSADGRQALLRLIATADVLCDNFKASTLKAMGLDHASLKALNPRLICVSHKGFLPGPYAHRTALDEVVQMMGGLAYMTGRPGDPLRAGASVNDIMGGMFGAIGVMAALAQRDKTGQGQEVQSALFENNVFLVAQHMMQFAVTQRAAQPMPARISAWGVYDVFEVLGGEQIFLAVVSNGAWASFCTAFGFADWQADARLDSNNARVLARPWLLPLLRQRLAPLSAQHIAQVFEAHALPFAPIGRPQDLFDDPHLNATGALADIELPDGRASRTVLLPLTLGGERLGVRHSPPKLGEHNAQVLAQLGYSAAQVAALGHPAQLAKD